MAQEKKDGYKVITKTMAAKACPSAMIYASTKGMDKAEWLKNRRGGIGGSEVAAILGLSKFSSEYNVYLDKISTEEPVEKHSPVLEWGTRIEPLIRAKAQEMVDGVVYEVPFMYKKKGVDYMRADLDGLELEPDGTWCIHEYKTTNQYNAGEWASGVPVYYITQVLHYMLVTGLRKAKVFCLIGGQTFVSHEILWDEALAAAIETAEVRFWHKVINRETPKPDGSKAATAAITAMFKGGNTETLELAEDTEANTLMSDYLALAEEVKAKEKALEGIKNRLKEKIGDHESANFSEGIYVTWRGITSCRVDTKALKAEMPEVYEKYTKTGTSRTFKVKKGDDEL